MGRKQHRFEGDIMRFEIVAKLVYETFGNTIQYIADVAGGQGMLTRILNKKYNYKSEVIDPRGWVLKGIPYRQKNFCFEDANYYDLIVGLHPDEATRAIVTSALVRPIIIVPCCNFWSENKLGTFELIESIEKYFIENKISFKKHKLSFKGPKNTAVQTFPAI